MGTKNHPGEFDCYEAADGDEPMFILLGRDEDAPALIEDWCRKRLAKLLASDMTREQLHRGVRKIAEALACANKMRTWALNDTVDDLFRPLEPPLTPPSKLFDELSEKYVASVCACPDHDRHGWATGLDGPGEKFDPRREPHSSTECEARGCYGPLTAEWRSARRYECSRSADCSYPTCFCGPSMAPVWNPAGKR